MNIKLNRSEIMWFIYEYFLNDFFSVYEIGGIFINFELNNLDILILIKKESFQEFIGKWVDKIGYTVNKRLSFGSID